MKILRRRGSWSRMTNISDRDITISLLRSAGHGNVLDRNVDLILSSKVKIDMDGNVVELILGKKDEHSVRLQQQRQRRRRQPAEGNNDTDHDDVTSFWDLSASVEKLRKLNKLVLCRCRSLPTTLHQLAELKCLELHFCDGNTMLQRQQTTSLSARTTENDGTLADTESRLTNLKTFEINGGIWDAQSIFWMKCMTATSVNVGFSNGNTEGHSLMNSPVLYASQLEIVRFSLLGNDLRDAILDFLSPFKLGETETSNRYSYDSEGLKGPAKFLELPTSRLKHLAWVHSKMTDQSLELLLRTVVLPHHPNLISIDISGNQIRSFQFLFELPANGKCPSISIGDTKMNENKMKGRSNTEQFHREQRQDQTFYHPLRTLNLQHNPVLRHRNSDHREMEALELLLRHFFPLLGSLTPSWENWDARIEYLLRINRGGRVLVEGNGVPPSLAASQKSRGNGIGASERNDQTLITTAETESLKRPTKEKIHLSMWPLILHRAYKTSSKGFLPPLENATAMYYLIRNGPALSEIYAGATT